MQQYLKAIQTIGQSIKPATSCRQIANTVRTVELIGPQPGTNLLSDDPRKVTEGVAEMRELSITNRVTLDVQFIFAASGPGNAINIFAQVNAQVRNGAFLNAVSKATYPLLEANTYVAQFTGTLN